MQSLIVSALHNDCARSAIASPNLLVHEGGLSCLSREGSRQAIIQP
ncbi:hypothetical protein [Chroococcidiopsis sp. TS-821]|nr:hypothetical protein [Chroococcidiopsis sp. TS-821]